MSVPSHSTPFPSGTADGSGSAGKAPGEPACARERAWLPTLARITWRALWVVPATGWVLTLPEAPAKWPALTLLVASALVLHADSIVRPIRRRLGSRI